MKILELTRKHVKDQVSQKRIATYIMHDILKCKKISICMDLNIKKHILYYYLNTINDYEKLIASYVIEDIDVITAKLERIKQLDKEIKRKEDSLNYVEIVSLYDPNIYFRFYDDGREEKVKKRPKKDA